MRSTQPPRSATWLLRQFGSSVDIESVIGDLQECFDGTRSSAWYWRQALLSIAALAAKDLRSHKFLALRALLVGWTLVMVGTGHLLKFVKTYYDANRVIQWLGIPRNLDDYDHEFWLFLLGGVVMMVVGDFVIGALSGWIVAKSHAPIRKSAVLLFAASTVVPLVAAFPRFYEAIIRPNPDGCFGDTACRLAPLTNEWGTILFWTWIVVSILFGGGLLFHRPDELPQKQTEAGHP